MGYETKYSLRLLNDTTLDPISDVHEIIDKLSRKYVGANFALKRDGETSNPCKWYTHQSELTNFSTNYPRIIFELEGLGEDGLEDYWRKYFYNGSFYMVKPTINFPPISLDKLK